MRVGVAGTNRGKNSVEHAAILALDVSCAACVDVRSTVVGGGRNSSASLPMHYLRSVDVQAQNAPWRPLSRFFIEPLAPSALPVVFLPRSRVGRACTERSITVCALHETNARTTVVGRRPTDCTRSLLQHMWRYSCPETLRFTIHSVARGQSCSADTSSCAFGWEHPVPITRRRAPHEHRSVPSADVVLLWRWNGRTSCNEHFSPHTPAIGTVFASEAVYRI
ncbi:MAG: hypothetical protein KatS3mg038_1705 [Candidatus Kapaibacterium sp.]|nr:MAG: hypothetical protein KatS3mg038_1705 [Candidatus Kapabacteria bacterium]